MKQTTDIYYNNRLLPMRADGNHLGFRYTSFDRDKGCCMFIRNRGYDVLIVVNHSDLPSMAFIKQFGFQNKEEYITWWVNTINSLNTVKLKIHRTTKTDTEIAMYDDEHPGHYQMLLGLTLLRYIWSTKSFMKPLLVSKLITLYPDIELPNILYLSLLLTQSRDGYGDVCDNFSYSLTLNEHINYYNNDANTGVYKRFDGATKSIPYKYHDAIRSIFNINFKFTQERYTSEEYKYLIDEYFNDKTIVSKVDNFFNFYNQLYLLNKEVKLNVSYDMYALPKNNKYKIIDIEIYPKITKIKILNNNFDGVTLPLSLFKLENV